MSRRTAAIEEEFDDDTDLPLPAFNLPNTGARGPLLQQLGDDAESDDDDDDRGAGPASSMGQGPFASSGSSAGRVTDITPYKTFVHVSHSSPGRSQQSSHGLSFFYYIMLTGPSDGPVSTRFIWMRNDRMGQASVGLRGERRYGGR